MSILIFIVEGSIIKKFLKSKIGEKSETKNGKEVLIIDGGNEKDKVKILIKTEKDVYQEVNYYKIFKTKLTNDPYERTVRGVGYRGYGSQVFDPKFSEREKEIFTKKRKLWVGIIERSYSKKWKEDHSHYKHVSMCDTWLDFQVFGKWFDDNFEYDIMSQWELDKDLFSDVGIKKYSPENCCFLPSFVNTFINNFGIKIKSNKSGYSGIEKTKSNRYRVKIRKNNILIHLGVFDNLEKANSIYRAEKEKHKKEIIERCIDLKLNKKIINKLKQI